MSLLAKKVHNPSNNAPSSEKVLCWPLTSKFTDILFRTVLDSFWWYKCLNLCIFLSWFRQDDKAILLMDSYFSWFEVKKRLDRFISYKRATFHFTRCLLIDWISVDYLWVIVMFLSAVWTLILTAPIRCRGSIGERWNAKFLQMCSDEETNLFTSWMSWGWVHFHFGVNYSFKKSWTTI